MLNGAFSVWYAMTAFSAPLNELAMMSRLYSLFFMSKSASGAILHFFGKQKKEEKEEEYNEVPTEDYTEEYEESSGSDISDAKTDFSDTEEEK